MTGPITSKVKASSIARRGSRMEAVTTPDGRYFVVRGRLWRASNPHLSDEARSELVHALMDARRAVKASHRDEDRERMAAARRAVNTAKIALGERGPVWWTDGTQDYNRYLVKNTPYADWYTSLTETPPSRA